MSLFYHEIGMLNGALRGADNRRVYTLQKKT